MAPVHRVCSSQGPPSPHAACARVSENQGTCSRGSVRNGHRLVAKATEVYSLTGLQATSPKRSPWTRTQAGGSRGSGSCLWRSPGLLPGLILRAGSAAPASAALTLLSPPCQTPQCRGTGLCRPACNPGSLPRSGSLGSSDWLAQEQAVGYAELTPELGVIGHCSQTTDWVTGGHTEATASCPEAQDILCWWGRSRGAGGGPSPAT